MQVASVQEHATSALEQTMRTPLMQSVFRGQPPSRVTPPRTGVLPSALRMARAQPSPEDNDVLKSALRQAQKSKAVLQPRTGNAQT